MKYARIKKNKEIQKLFKKGNKVFSRALTALFIPSDEIRMAVIVSKKHGKAVKRNRIKRLVRQAFFNTCEELKKPCAMVIIPREAESYCLESFEKSLRQCYSKIKEWSKK